MKLKRLQVGQRIRRFPVKTWNTLCDYVDRSGPARLNDSMPQAALAMGTRNHGVMLLRNNTGQQRDAGDVLGILDPAEDPNRTGAAGEAVQGLVPNLESSGTVSETTHKYAHAVLVESIGYEEWGHATCTGFVFAKVDITDQSHKFCTLRSGEYHYVSDQDGPYPIVWKPSLNGIHRCIVRLDAVGGGGETFPDLIVVGILAQPLIPYGTGTGTAADLVDGQTKIIHGEGAYATPPGDVLKNIQIRKVINYLNQWQPQGGYVVAVAWDTGAVTANQTPPSNNGLPIFDLGIINVEPPEFTIELELDDDLPPIRRPADIDYSEVGGRPFENIWGYAWRSEFLAGDKATFNPSLLTAKKGQPIIATIRRKERPLPGASIGENTQWLVTILGVPANTLTAYGFLLANCSSKDQTVALSYVQGIGWEIPQTGEDFPHGPAAARNIWNLRGRQGDRVKLTYVPSGFVYADQPGGTPSGDPIYWLIDMIEPRMTEAVYGLRVDGVHFQKQVAAIFGWSDVLTSGGTWTTWATGEECPTTNLAGDAPPRRPNGWEPPPEDLQRPPEDCGCGGGG